jgi:hypothetical protein
LSTGVAKIGPNIYLIIAYDSGQQSEMEMTMWALFLELLMGFAFDFLRASFGL